VKILLTFYIHRFDIVVSDDRLSRIWKTFLTWLR